MGHKRELIPRLKTWSLEYTPPDEAVGGAQARASVKIDLDAPIHDDVNVKYLYFFRDKGMVCDGCKTEDDRQYFITRDNVSSANAIELFDDIADKPKKVGNSSPEFTMDVSKFPEDIRDAAYVRAVASIAGGLVLKNTPPITDEQNGALMRDKLCLADARKDDRDDFDRVLVRCENAHEAKGLVRYWHDHGWAKDSPHKAARSMYEILHQEQRYKPTETGPVFVPMPHKLAKDAIPKITLPAMSHAPALPHMTFNHDVPNRFPHLFLEAEKELHSDPDRYVDLMKSCLLRECGVNVGVNKVHCITAQQTELLPHAGHLFKTRNNPKSRQLPLF